MIGDHIAQRTRFFVVARTAADAERFGGGDFDVVNVVAIPDRLEDRIAEAKDEYVLDGLFAEIMINAKDLMLVEHRRDLCVQALRRFEIAPERFFDDDARPTIRLVIQSGRAEMFDHDGRERWRRRKIE